MGFLFAEMDNTIEFFVDAKPVAQPRQRHMYNPNIRNDDGSKGKVISYIPKVHPIWVFKQIVRIRAKYALRADPFRGPVSAVLLFLIERPDRLKTGGRVWAPTRPDIDNYEKAILDALNPIRDGDPWGLWRDDAQVCEVIKRKLYAASDEPCGVRCAFKELE